ncbi:hypothetical protein TRV_00825 [Trichophyton verrucosum HKI 0517]|nr:uncharacterized protein TRV_00825 [Trichophyton verrucosum HKI 0517]EFE44409.1 hypothetical protein TRV_00825 [Trichophyton verrucosum HKI 0517]
MHQLRLNDAAISLHRVLSAHGVKFGIFGGYAVAALGGPRESKDVDCLACVNKDQILNILDGKSGFVAVPQSRRDYVAFLWSDKPTRERAVLVEIFCEGFPGATFNMSNVVPNVTQIAGETQGSGATSFLDPVYLFKGKLRAAATRSKFHDSADLRWLETYALSILQANKSQFSSLYVGLALKRYPELHHCFERIGLNIDAATNAAAAYDLHHLPPPQPGDVQNGLLATGNT